MDTEKLLTGLFDFQRFEDCPELRSVILDTEKRYLGEELSDDELKKLSAAGDPFLLSLDPKKRKEPL